jgi:hypothetical protein
MGFPEAVKAAKLKPAVRSPEIGPASRQATDIVPP